MNNKGLTLTEIIVSISIVSLVMVFMFQVLITVKTSNDRHKAKTEALVNTSIIMQSVQKDLKTFNLKDINSVSNCSSDSENRLTNQAGIKNQIIPSSVIASNTYYYCVKLIYNPDNVKYNEGYLLFYQNNNKGFIGYKRGKDNYMAYTNVVEIDAIPLEPSDGFNTYNIIGDNNFYSLKIDIPIVAKDNNTYDLAVSYIKK